MKGWGITLIILGIGAFILPHMGVQFLLISIFGQGNEAVTGVVFIVIGGILTFVGRRSE